MDAMLKAQLLAPSPNKILAGLPPAYQHALLLRMATVALRQAEVLYVPHRIPESVYFPLSGVISINDRFDEISLSVGLIGRESMTGALHLLGDALPVTSAHVQIEGEALRMPLEELRREFLACQPLREAILRTIQRQAMSGEHLQACNRLHSLTQRLVRWLLSLDDRVGHVPMALTQEMVADALGTNRTTVTLAAKALQDRGLIRYSRGLLRILDRPGLEEIACECYFRGRITLDDAE